MLLKVIKNEKIGLAWVSFCKYFNYFLKCFVTFSKAEVKFM